MPQTIDLNKKANVKQSTAADVLSSGGLPVMAEYAAESIAAQTLIPASGSLPFSIDTSTPENVWVFVDGKRLRYGASNDFVFSEIDGSGFSSKIQLNAPLAAGLNIMISKLGIKKEVEFMTDARFSALYDMSTAAFQGMVDESARLTAVNGAPSAGQFRTFGIVNRASIPDLANDLKARMGIDRVQIQQIVELQNEFGPNGEQVFGAVNDDRNLIRFVGKWSTIAGTSGVVNTTSTLNDYMEIVFYGTGLNILHNNTGSGYDLRVTVDGGVEGGNILTTISNVLGARNYTPNMVIPLTSNLSLGLHTVKIRNAASAASFYMSGIEILNESANVSVRPGVAYQGGKKLILSAADSTAYNTGFESVTREGASVAFSSTRGARVVEYLKSDNTKAKAAYLTNSAVAYLGSADHAYEEMVRRHNFREFGANRSDDFSTLTTASARAFTLDDGTTTLTTNSSEISSLRLRMSVASTSFITLTFVGTGLDLIASDETTGAYGSANILIDGVVVANASSIAPASATGIERAIKIVSGLPYGTHTFTIFRPASGNFPHINSFLVYQPKKPTVPAGAVELADYNIMADYVAVSASGLGRMSAGVLRKYTVREALHAGGSWVANFNTEIVSSGAYISSNGASDYLEYVFFGTGIDIRLGATNSGYTASISVDGSTNLSGFTTATVGTNHSLVAATGALTVGINAAHENAVIIRDIPLGIHKIRVTRTGGANSIVPSSFDIITPIHAVKGSFPGEIQNSLMIGSCGISDSRKTSLIESEDPKKFRGVAQGITSGPSTSSTSYVPIPEMTMAVTSNGNWFRVTGNITTIPSTGGGPEFLAIFANGQRITNDMDTGVGGGVGGSVFVGYTNETLVYLSKGTHLIQWCWRTSGNPITARGTARILTVEEL